MVVQLHFAETDMLLVINVVNTMLFKLCRRSPRPGCAARGCATSGAVLCGKGHALVQQRWGFRLAGGVPGRDAPPDGAPPVQLYFANPDMLWANEFPTPRLGQGAFAACVRLLHKEVSQYDKCSKPLSTHYASMISNC